MRPYSSLRAICCGAAATVLLVRASLADDRTEPLTLARVCALVEGRSPALAGFAAEVHARAARTAQSNQLPNPELRTDFENVGGTGDREGVEQTETTLRVSQLIELGGKRDRRRRIAELERDVAAWDYEAKKRALLADATTAFVHALAAQERVALAAQLEDLARQEVASVRRRVDAGASSGVDLARVRVVLGNSELEKHRAERTLAAARRALAASWGDDEASFGRLEGNLTTLHPLPARLDVETSLAENPDFKRATTERDERGAALELEQVARIPDVTVGAGARHFSDNGDYALVFEISAPIPVFDRNQGGIEEAHHRLRKAHAERDALRLSLRAALANAQAEVAAAYEQAIGLRDHLLPTAQSAFDEARTAHQQGLLGFVDVLDAQRTLFALRGDYLTALEAFHRAVVEVEQLTGRALFDPSAVEEDR